jgi:hypothetical protein
VLFTVVGPFLLGANCVVDLGWFFRHLYKMDLEKSRSAKEGVTVDINRRTYKKMLRYFEQKNEQLVQ